MSDTSSMKGDLVTPEYHGPTAAERYCDDLAAIRSLGRHDLPRPPQLQLAEIVKRYPPATVENDGDGLPAIVGFLDGSAARRVRARWEVVR